MREFQVDSSLPTLEHSSTSCRWTTPSDLVFGASVTSTITAECQGCRAIKTLSLLICFPYHKGKEHGCVAMGTGIAAGLWDVVSCEKTANYLCKQAAGVLPPAPLVRVPVAETCAEGWDGASWADSCFGFFVREGNLKKSWFEAEEFCREIGGNLVTINTREDQILLWQLTSDKGLHTQGFWIGLFLLNPDERFAWIDGSPVIYENWDEHELHSHEELEHCVMFNRSPQMCWNNLHCEHLLNWICETKKL
ncbi:LOW QUALITY PROTEIN: macrophage mannose receptor 1-like [Pterocles gutturalis]